MCSCTQQKSNKKISFSFTALLPLLALFAVALMLMSTPVRAESVIATVPTGSFPYAIALNPVTNKTYVANATGNTVTVIDNATHSANTVEVGLVPRAIAVNPVTNKIYVVNINSGNVTVIDGVTNSATPVELAEGIGSAPFAIAVNPVTNKMYVTHAYSTTVTVLDGETHSVSAVAVGSQPHDVAVNPVTNKIYVADYWSNTVTVIDGATNGTSTLDVGFYRPHTIAVNSVTNKIYVANLSADVTVIDGATNSVSTVSTSGVGGGVGFIAVNPVTNKIYVAKEVNQFTTGAVLVIDGLTNSVTSVAMMAGYPRGLVVNPVTNKIYVANQGANNVMVIDGATSAASTVAVGLGPTSITVNLATNRIYVANIGENTVSVIGEADSTPPVISVSQTPLANTNGWNNTDVTVSFTAADDVSTPTCTVNTETLTAEGSAQVVSTTCTDAAGNSASASHTVNIDKTAPVVTGTRTPAANAFGWNNSDVTVHFSASDGLSGISGSADADVVMSSDGSGQTASASFTDLAGNSSSATVSNINIDKTAPVLTMPSLAGSYGFNSSLTLTFGSSDALSQIATQSATLNGNPVSSGDTVVLSQLGTNTFVLTATDKAGNTVTETRQFSVNYTFGGFLSPLSGNRTTFHLGSVIPVKFDLYDANGVAISNAVASLSLQQYSGEDPVGDPIDATPTSGADSGNQFRYSGGHYMYNLSTKPFSAGIWRIQATLDDGSVHAIEIGLSSK